METYLETLPHISIRILSIPVPYDARKERTQMATSALLEKINIIEVKKTVGLR